MVKYKIVQKVYALQRRFILSERNHFFQRIKRIFTGLKRLLTYNIATIMFGALLLYMIITVVLYATSSHVTSYQVTVGPLTKNPVCTGLALRKEQIVPAGASGYVEYYAREGAQGWFRICTDE